MTQSPTRYAMNVITESRQAQGVTSEDMVIALTSKGYGITYHQYRAAEDGRTQRVPVDLVAYAAAILDIDPRELIRLTSHGHTVIRHLPWDDLDYERQREIVNTTKINNRAEYETLRERGDLDKYL